MRRILFVDDETKVLDGLRRMLRPMRKEWEMHFAEGGEDALARLAEQPFVVVVSDMRMPGMDGATLLTRVMQQHPEVVRIVLSGQSSQESTLKSVGVAHRFLAKPTDAQTLRQTIENAFQLRRLLDDNAVKKIVSQLVSVPCMPALYEELLDELQHEDASIQRIGAIVEKDPGMAAKILQLVNSAFFGIPRQVSSPAEATSLLGADTIKALVLGMEVFSQFKKDDVAGFNPEAVQEHSTKVAAMAKQIAEMEKADREFASSALMAGFLHDIGKLILAQGMPKQYRAVTKEVFEKDLSLIDAERKLLGTTHAEVGAYLLGLWGLPDSIVEAAAFHHSPSESCGEEFSPLTAVHAANTFALDPKEEGIVGTLDLDYLGQLGLADRAAVWRETCVGSATTAEV